MKVKWVPDVHLMDAMSTCRHPGRQLIVCSPMSDEFELWNLRVEVTGDPETMVCSHTVGDSFEVSGENLSMPSGQSFSMYALAAILPLLPAKQRVTHANDWMTTDAEIACPDPNCGARFRITRTGKSTFRHGETTRVPLSGNAD